MNNRLNFYELYGATIFKCSIETSHNNFVGAIILGDGYTKNEFFGEKISLNNNKKILLKVSNSLINIAN